MTESIEFGQWVQSGFKMGSQQMYIKLYNVTISADTSQKQFRMAVAVAEDAGLTMPKPAKFEAEKFVIAICAEEGGHDEKAEEWKAAQLEEYRVTTGIDIEPVMSGYAYPKPISPDIWIMSPGHIP